MNFLILFYLKDNGSFMKKKYIPLRKFNKKSINSKTIMSNNNSSNEFNFDDENLKLNNDCNPESTQNDKFRIFNFTVDNNLNSSSHQNDNSYQERIKFDRHHHHHLANQFKKSEIHQISLANEIANDKLKENFDANIKESAEEYENFSTKIPSYENLFKNCLSYSEQAIIESDQLAFNNQLKVKSNLESFLNSLMAKSQNKKLIDNEETKGKQMFDKSNNEDSSLSKLKYKQFNANSSKPSFKSKFSSNSSLSNLKCAQKRSGGEKSRTTKETEAAQNSMNYDEYFYFYQDNNNSQDCQKQFEIDLNENDEDDSSDNNNFDLQNDNEDLNELNIMLSLSNELQSMDEKTSDALDFSKIEDNNALLQVDQETESNCFQLENEVFIEENNDNLKKISFSYSDLKDRCNQEIINDNEINSITIDRLAKQIDKAILKEIESSNSPTNLEENNLSREDSSENKTLDNMNLIKCDLSCHEQKNFNQPSSSSSTQTAAANFDRLVDNKAQNKINKLNNDKYVKKIASDQIMLTSRKQNALLNQRSQTNRNSFGINSVSLQRIRELKRRHTSTSSVISIGNSNSLSSKNNSSTTQNQSPKVLTQLILQHSLFNDHDFLLNLVNRGQANNSANSDSRQLVDLNKSYSQSLPPPPPPLPHQKSDSPSPLNPPHNTLKVFNKMSYPPSHNHDEFVLRCQFSALIPAFDPRPGKNNINQIQDISVPSQFSSYATFSKLFNMNQQQSNSKQNSHQTSHQNENNQMITSTYGENHSQISSPQTKLDLYLKLDQSMPSIKSFKYNNKTISCDNGLEFLVDEIKMTDKSATIFQYIQNLIALNRNQTRAQIETTGISNSTLLHFERMRTIWDMNYLLIYRESTTENNNESADQTHYVVDNDVNKLINQNDDKNYSKLVVCNSEHVLLLLKVLKDAIQFSDPFAKKDRLEFLQSFENENDSDNSMEVDFDANNDDEKVDVLSLFDESSPSFFDLKTEFISEKLNNKLIQQLQDPLVLGSKSLPDWCKYLVQSYKFLFPFETRKLYFITTAFGVSRSIVWLQSKRDALLNSMRGPLFNRGMHRNITSATTSGNSEAGFDDYEFRIGRLKHERIKIPRSPPSSFLKAGVDALRFHATRKSILEIEFADEEGTGLGPTLEFFSLIALQLQLKKFGLWCYSDDEELDENMRINEEWTHDNDGYGDDDDDDEKEKEKEEDEANMDDETTAVEDNNHHLNKQERRRLNRDDAKTNTKSRYVHQLNGLFPAAYPNIDLVDMSQIGFDYSSSKEFYIDEYNRVIDFFNFLGIFLAKSLQDQRLVDIPFSKPFLKILCSNGIESTFFNNNNNLAAARIEQLNHQEIYAKSNIINSSLNLDDLELVDPHRANLLKQFKKIVIKYKQFRSRVGKKTAPHELEIEINNQDEFKVEINGHKLSVEDLGLVFEYNPPSKFYFYNSYKLKPNGENIPVTIHNLEEYVELITKFLLKDGIEKQLEAFKSKLHKF